MESIVHYHIKITGTVQGVGYRVNAKKVAENLKINGWIRNEDDGTVTIEAEGKPENMEMFLKWCEQGPSNAIVEDMTYEKGDARALKAFNINL